MYHNILTHRLEWIDRMRGLAILSVVIQHLTQNYENEFIYQKFIGISNMAVFFFISGFIWNRTAHINSIKEATIYIIKKTIQIFIPFISWTFLIYPYSFQENWQIWNVTEIINEFINPHFWFLLTLYGYSFYFVIFRIIDKYGGIIFGTIFLFISFGVLCCIWYKLGWFKMETLYMPYFAAGVMLSHDNLIEKILPNKILFTLSLICIFTLLSFWKAEQTSIINIIIKLIISISTISIIYFICKQDNWNKYIEKFVMNCGKHSLAIYVMHWTFLGIVKNKTLIPQNELLGFMPMLIIAILICYVCIFFRSIISYSPLLDTILLGNSKHIKI